MPRTDTEPTAATAGILRARAQTTVPDPAATPGLHVLDLDGRRDGAFLVPEGLDAAKPTPLVLALHGAGGIASQMIDFLADTAARHGVVILAPESRTSTWDVIRGGYGPDVDFIDRALGKVFQNVLIDPKRIAISGFSDGASYALSIGIVNGALFSDILAFSPGFMAPTEQEDSPRIFISHGIRDEVLPINPCSRRLAPALEHAGYDVEYLEFDDGHIVPDSMVERAMARFLG
ncbi:alpha/beta hydrolase [Microvirga roseola]|uniref:alpha/beta hydrolase n=1 Tax=Microvirga roseola TaxID=2883126 RepID=UPI001E5DBAC4|nr:phospholipase [Microvirga roseola]